MDDLSRSLGWGISLSRYPFLCKVFAFWVVFKEFLAPLALHNNKKAQLFVVFSLFFMMVGFYFTCTSGFVNMLFLYLCWLPLLSRSNEIS